jgi:tyrosine-protein phosphatase YwqE
LGLRHKEKVKEHTSNTYDIPITYLSNISNKIICNYCHIEYSNSSSLAGHKKVCSIKKGLEKKYQHENEQLQREINHLKELAKNDAFSSLKAENLFLHNEIYSLNDKSTPINLLASSKYFFLFSSESLSKNNLAILYKVNRSKS